jgi:hydroxypyruvate reductase
MRMAPAARSNRWDRLRLRRAARDILAAGLDAADPARLVRRHLRLDDDALFVAGVKHRFREGRRLVLVAAGKAAATMARAAEDVLGDRLSVGLAVDSSEPREPLARTRLRVARHPLPDRRGLRAAAEVESLARGLGRDDLLLLLISGGASALLPAPVPGITLEDKASVTSSLLRAGATIGELNTVRKHLSRLKGGGLARAAWPARVVCLVLSDVVGDDLSTIASGPTVPDPTTYAEALEVLRHRHVLGAVPRSVRRHLEGGAAGRVPETPKPKDRAFRRVTTRIVGSNRWTVEAAAQEARKLGLRALTLTTFLEGEAREVARALVSVLRECVESGSPGETPVCLLAGGETTVTVRGDGLGGRNQELVVAAAEALSLFPAHAVVASLATDGIDGVSGAAGGIVDQDTVRRAAGLGLAPAAVFLAASDSASFLAPLGDLIVTGPTGTNVVDLTILLAGDSKRGRTAP